MFLFRPQHLRSLRPIVRRLLVGHLSFSSESKSQDRPPGESYQIKIIESERDWNEIWPSFRSSLERFPALGFDCEWPPPWIGSPDESSIVSSEMTLPRRTKKRTNVSLVQLATRDGTAALIRVDRIDSIPESLRTLLADPTFLKVGVEAVWDAKFVVGDYPQLFEKVLGTFDVRYLLFQNPDGRYSRSKLNRLQSSLNSLCQSYLLIDREKDPRIVCSDWAAPVLSPEQIDYAAADAQLSIDLFVALVQYVGLKTSREAWDSVYELCRPYLNQQFRWKTEKPPQFFPQSPSSSNHSSNGTDNGSQEGHSDRTDTDTSTLIDRR